MLCFGSEVLTAVTMKGTVFWDIRSCGPVKVNRRFGGIYLLRLKGHNVGDFICYVRQKKIITKNVVMENYVRSRSIEGTFQHLYIWSVEDTEKLMLSRRE
jgi:hypothetical protein